MKSYKELLNKVVNETSILQKIEDEDAKALKKCILDIYTTITKICDRHHLNIMLAGGSCLGAIRHQGFIPWDDDLDVMMPRPDYEKFLNLCEQGILGDKLEFRHPQGDKSSTSMFLKIYMKGTKIIGLGGEDDKYPQMVFLDVFPLDGVPNNLLLRKYKGFIANGIRLIANVVLEDKPFTKTQKELYSKNKELYRMKCYRKMIGKIFSIVNHQKWVRWFDSFVKNDNMTGMIGIPTGRKLYGGEIFPASVFFPVSKGIFEGIEVNLPSNPGVYLNNLYGDYMKIPPSEKRESHMIVELQLPSKYYK